MFYSHKDSVIRINENQILARNAELSTAADITPVYDVSSPFNSNYAANFGLRGTLKLNYFLTGQDPLKEYIILEDRNPISGNLGGLWFESGYLKNYSINFAPNEPAVVNAEIIFFDKINGEFSANPSPTRLNYPPIMHLSNVTINTTQSTEVFEDVISASYAFSNDIKSNFYVNSETGLTNVSPDRIFFGIKELRMEIVTDTLSGSLPLYGRPSVGGTFTLQTPDGSQTEVFACTGQLLQKTISTSVGQPVINTLSIVNNNLKEVATVLSFNPTEGYVGDLINIYGENFDLIESVYFGEKITSRTSPTNPVKLISPTHIQAYVPNNAISAPIAVQSIFGNKSTSTERFIVHAEEPVTNWISPTGLDGLRSKSYSIIVSGEDIQRPTRVFIGDLQANFIRSRENPDDLYVQSPEYVKNGFITLYEDYYGFSAISPYKIYFPPVLSGLFPQSGLPTETFTISGRNLTDATGVYFLRNDDEKVSATFTVSDDDSIEVTIPEGNCYGKILVYNPSGLTASSTPYFKPSIGITGIHPISGVTGSVLRISGFNFQEELLYSPWTDSVGAVYRVYFGNDATGAFYRSSDTLLTGIIPTGAGDGPIEFRGYGRPSDNIYPTFTSPMDFYVLKTPEVTSVRSAYRSFHAYASDPNQLSLHAYSGGEIKGFILGENFRNIQLIRFSGWSGEADGYVFDLTSSYFSVSADDDKISVSGFYAENLPSGFYNVGVGNTAGSGIFETGFRLNDKFNYAAYAEIEMEAYHPKLYRESLLKDGVINGSASRYSIAITAQTVNPYIEFTLGKMEVLHGYEIYASEGSHLTYTTDLTVSILDENRDTVFSDVIFPGGGTYPSAPDYKVSNIFPRVTGKYFRIERNGASSTHLALSEVVIF